MHRIFSSMTVMLLRTRTVFSRHNFLLKRTIATQKSATSSPKRSTLIFSGIQPTGIPHIGNYLGALSNWIDLQKTADPDTAIFYCIVDLHAITVPQNPDELRKAKRDMAMTLLACGVNLERSVLFEQSKVSQHAELAWLLNTITPVGLLSRMTQWKSKIGQLSESQSTHSQNILNEAHTAGLKMGLFDYPVLMAADILLYKATEIPVGDDQSQHIELAREIAQTFNKTFKRDFFPLPNGLIPTSTKRIMSLRNPTQKMSKSDALDYSRLNLTDPPDLVTSKISRATTDSLPGITYDPQTRPGISNLISIYAAFKNVSIEEVVKEFEKEMSTKAFKDALVEVAIDKLSEFQKELERVNREGERYVDEVLEIGAKKAREVAEKNLQEVYKIVGLR